jgi:hypothetical protein
MNSQKSRLIVAISIILFAASGSLSVAGQPVLKIGGKENPDVYLQSLDIQVEITGSIASTRQTMVFKNKTDIVLAGELTFPLPDGRTVTYYALDINGKMREGVPVEKMRATQFFEAIDPHRTHPGLLERVDGNNFRTLIDPIPVDGIRTISIGYTEELTLEKGSLQYRLPMAFTGPIENFSVTATIRKSNVKPIVSDSDYELIFDSADENYTASFVRENYLPAKALCFTLPAPIDTPRIMVQPAQGSYYFLASITPKIETRKKQWADDLAIIWDVSLSGSQRDLNREMETLDIIFAEKKNANVHLYFLNNTLTKITNKNTVNGEYKVSNGNWDELKNILKKAAFDGGTDFSKINLNAISGSEILFFSDGISTLSDTDFVGNKHIARPIHCVVSSEATDYSAMKSIAGRTSGKFVNLNTLSSDGLKDELLNETPRFLGTEHGDAVREVYPGVSGPVHGNFSLAGISDTNTAELTLLFGFGNTIEKRFNIRLDANEAVHHENVYKFWAQKKIAELDLNYEKNRDELTALGRQFGIITRNTSLIAFETLDDYIRRNITPPAELQDEYLSKKERKERLFYSMREMKSDMFNTAITAAQNLKTWWNTDPKKKEAEKQAAALAEKRAMERAVKKNERAKRREQKRAARHRRRKHGHNHCGDMIFEAAEIMCVYGDWYTPVYIVDIDDPNADPIVLDPPFSGGGIRKSRDGSGNRSGVVYGVGYGQPVALKSIRTDSDYLNNLTGKIKDDYQTYLSLRDDYAASPTFYLDMADWFYRHNDKELALRVLTSIADFSQGNAPLYRLLGYRLKEYGEYALEKFVCQKVIRWRPMEPQNYRDYANALADNGEAQAALDSLYALLMKPFPASTCFRNYGMNEVVIMEINRLITQNANLNTSKIDTRVMANIPIDIRVVINWNINNTFTGLHVKDPNNEDCHSKNSETRIGGRISGINSYGPEQFILRKAIKGKYRVSVRYYGDDPLTVMAEIYTKYADKTEQRRVVCLPISNVKEDDGMMTVTVAEFDF